MDSLTRAAPPRWPGPWHLAARNPGLARMRSHNVRRKPPKRPLRSARPVRPDGPPSTASTARAPAHENHNPPGFRERQLPVGNPRLAVLSVPAGQPGVIRRARVVLAGRWPWFLTNGPPQAFSAPRVSLAWISTEKDSANIASQIGRFCAEPQL